MFARPATELRKSIVAGNLKRVIVISRIANAFGFVFLPAGITANEKTVIFAYESFAAFCVLQCRVHEVWARFLGSTLKDDLQYAPSDCFGTFCFPSGFETRADFEAAGRAYYDFRANLMVRNDEGLTKTYNRFHDPGEMSSDIIELRRLHCAMDHATLDAYGWTDIQPVCAFFPEFDDEVEEEDDSTRHKKHFRYRWPDEIRDEVLARLLALNQKTYEEEVLAGLHDRADGSRPTRRRKSGAEDEIEDQGELDL